MLLGEGVLTGMRESRQWGGGQEGGVDDTLDSGSESRIDGTCVVLQAGWPPAWHQEQRLDATEGCPHGQPIFIGRLDDLGVWKLWSTREVPHEQAQGLAEGGKSGRYSASELPGGAGHPYERDRSCHEMFLSGKQFLCEQWKGRSAASLLVMAAWMNE